MLAVDYIQILIPVLGLLANAVSQITMFRYGNDKEMTKSVVFGFLIGLSSIVIMQTFFRKSVPSDVSELAFVAATNIITYIGLSFCLFCVMGLGVSLRLRILTIIFRSPDGIPYSKITDEFDETKIYERRLSRLINNGQIKEEGGRLYTCDSMFLTISRMNTVVKRILTGKSSEFE